MAGSFEVSPLTDRQVEVAAGQLARAFFDYPLWTWLIPDEARRAKLLPLSALVSVRWGVLMRETYITDPAAGIAIWMPPDAHDGDLDPDGSRTGWHEFERQAGPWIVERLEAMSAEQRPRRDDAAAGQPYWYLPWLGVDPRAQRSGAGSALLAAMFVRTDAASVACILETEKAANVPYYERHGFSVSHEGVVPLGGPPYWTMIRRPA
jgi:ribosomal protein S18 acetylase RimI-like enzyme